MSWIIGMVVFIVFLWAMGETPEDRRIDEKNRHEAMQNMIAFEKSERERRKKELNRKRPPLWS